ncbi:c-type cytochrome [Leptospira sp. GIMC2001]|uniref:c-type cytochrome n=1 Tax=Leptospira sp. GIMC2001 TaxID=1513297 RepID=UPI00234A6D67|nr:cytochrome c [Leptospira sp. GIMC2001]WCL49016.1 cytochrome c [Leptospira sp. GIMC2001]
MRIVDNLKFTETMKLYNYSIMMIRLFLIGLLLGCANEPVEENSISTPKPLPPAVTVPIDESLYRQNGCEACHGVDGSGNYERAKTNQLPDFRSTKTYKYGHSVTKIQESIRKGIPGTSMKSYKQLKEYEIQSISKYIKKMQEN